MRVIDVGSGGNLDVVVPLGESTPARQNLPAHADAFQRMAGIAVAAEYPVRGVSIDHLRDIDHQGAITGFARNSLHLGESVSEVAFRVAVHVFVEVVGSEMTQRALLLPAGNKRATGHICRRGKRRGGHGASKQ